MRSSVLIPAHGLSAAVATATSRSGSSSSTTEAIPTESATGSSASAAAKLSYRSAAALAALSLSLGFAAGRSSHSDDSHAGADSSPHVLPNGLPRTCCDDDDDSHHKQPALTAAQKDLKHQLARLVGADNVLDGTGDLNPSTAPYLQGARLGQGRALCIVAPRRLHHVQEILELALAADCVVLPQGQNTGLTGGSVPRASSNDNNNNARPVVVLSMKHLTGIFPIDDGKRVVCLAGTGLATVRLTKQQQQ